MKHKEQIESLLLKALELLKKQVLTSEELKARAMVNFALEHVKASEDSDKKVEKK